MKEDVERHCQALEACQQRPGRMLSVVDLIERETMSVEAAALALEIISSSGSFIVGARPGGAGKTTVMVALLNFIPPGMEIVPTDTQEKLKESLYQKPTCFLCHEIGRGPYYGYLWGSALLSFFSLKTAGHLLASNLHADTLEEARHQICLTNQVPESLFQKIELYLFIRVENNGRRVVKTGWCHSAGRPQLVIVDGQVTKEWPEKQERLRTHAHFLRSLVASQSRSLRQVRAAVRDYLKTVPGYP